MKNITLLEKEDRHFFKKAIPKIRKKLKKKPYSLSNSHVPKTYIYITCVFSHEKILVTYIVPDIVPGIQWACSLLSRNTHLHPCPQVTLSLFSK
jgi:hypothetical protein